MDSPVNNQVMALIVTAIALAVSAVIFADMYNHGLISAVPRDAAALLVFALLRTFIARTLRPAVPDTAPDPEPAPAPEPVRASRFA